MTDHAQYADPDQISPGSHLDDFGNESTPTAHPENVTPGSQHEPTTEHTRDEHCIINPDTLLCSVCGVDHSSTCPDCGKRGFHSGNCFLNPGGREEADPLQHFGTVHYETGDGRPSQSIPCKTQADFEREIEAGCKWVESDRFRYRGVWGERA